MSKNKKGLILIISAGTADIPIAEEAAETANICGAYTEKIYDVGVAGILDLTYFEKIQEARAIVAVAGMGCFGISCSVWLLSSIAVPTSVGYGAHLNGILLDHAKFMLIKYYGC